ncbi:MAG: helix-turn-helix transcriptional regulator [Terracidiphilus sp.]|jgi:predicted XRE-type DNA-binding protein
MRNAKAPVNVETEHVTTDNIFADLGFSPAQAVELTIKSDLHRSLLERIRASGMTQVELAKVLQVHQPDVSNLLRGKLNLFSITKLCQYADRLKLKVRIEVEDTRSSPKPMRSRMKPVQRGISLRNRAPGRSITSPIPKATRRAVA